FDLFGVLGAGGAVVGPRPDGKQDPRGWAEAMGRRRAALWGAGAGVAGGMVSPGGAGAPARLSGFGPALCRRGLCWLAVSAAVGGWRMFSFGGATEAAIWSIF